tara:strand:- start:2490 stop:3506 length:1017 start_codon:yes stop_codon:yes gene_type:complete
MSFSDTYTPTKTPVTGPGSAVSNREDLTDVLTILAPEETPVLSSASKKAASSTFVEWTVDKLSAPSTNGIAEGVDVTTFTDQFAGRARLGNYVQKFRRDYMVSDLQDAVESVGPAKIAQAEAKAIRELKRDVEASLVSDNDRSAENGAGTPYKLRGLGDWLDSAGPSDVPADYRTPSGSINADGVAITETSLNEMIRSIYKEIGTTQNLTLIADTSLRTQISDYARFAGTAGNGGTPAGEASVRNVNYNGDSSTIKLSVDLYQSDFGTISIVNSNPDCSPAGTTQDRGYLINPEFYGIHELIGMGSSRLPNLGGGERGYVDCSLTLGMYHPAAHGKIS